MNTRRGMGRGLGCGYKNIAPMDAHIHSLSAKGVRSVLGIPLSEKQFKKAFTFANKNARIWNLSDDEWKKLKVLEIKRLYAKARHTTKEIFKTIAGDVNEYEKTYDKGALNYLIDDYSRSGLIKRYERLYGSDQQIARDSKGNTIYDSLRDGELTLEKFNKIIKSNLDMSKLKSNKSYIVEYADTKSMGTYVKDFGTQREAKDFLKQKLSESTNIPARTILKVRELNAKGKLTKKQLLKERTKLQKEYDNMERLKEDVEVNMIDEKDKREREYYEDDLDYYENSIEEISEKLDKTNDQLRKVNK